MRRFLELKYNSLDTCFVSCLVVGVFFVASVLVYLQTLGGHKDVGECEVSSRLCSVLLLVSLF